MKWGRRVASSEPFTGEFRHAIDGKGRVTIPQKLREQIQPREQGYVFYVDAGYDRTLRLFTAEMYRRQKAALWKAPDTDPRVRTLQRLTFGEADRVEVDKMNRVLLPERLLKLADISTNVVILGVGDHIEIWDEARWDAWLKEAYAQRDALADEVGRAMAEADAAQRDRDRGRRSEPGPAPSGPSL